jgi:hypothetical protein
MQRKSAGILGLTGLRYAGESRAEQKENTVSRDRFGPGCLATLAMP